MKRFELNGKWTLKGDGLSVDATVPGCVHTDLMAAGIIKDIFYRDENEKYKWIEERVWEYSCTFDSDVPFGARLVFEGLDTYAEIYLNGRLLGKTRNMFIPHSFEVEGILKQKNNMLCVRFMSPTKEVEDRPPLKGAFTTERLYSRRVQCTYGWDWVERFVTAGIWKPVYIVAPNGIDLEDVYVYTTHIDRYGAQLVAEMSFCDIGDGDIATVEIFSPDGDAVVKKQFFADMLHTTRRFDIYEPLLWYPAGYGEQPLYRMRVTVGENVRETVFGIRTLRLAQISDAEGSEYFEKAMAAQETVSGRLYSNNTEFSGFFAVVNGVRINCKGANWVPCEPFMSAETDEKIKRIVGLASKMGVNLIRVWGGGIFERNTFYDECDRLGILVAQDFLMACGSYPEKEEWFINELSREAEFAARYLRNHPCLAWWHGDNENAVKGSDVRSDYTGRDSALRGIAPVLERLDYTRQLLPSSPYGGDTYASITAGTAHNTNYIHIMFKYFNESDCTDYKEYLADYTGRFISEEPIFGAVNRSTALRFMTEDDLFCDDTQEMIYFHTKTNPPLKVHLFDSIAAFARKILGDFRDGEDRFFKYKYIQYEWIRVVFENARRNLGYCDGMIFWMLNDCWPAFGGWSLIDYYGMPKQAFYSFRRCASPIIGSVTEGDGRYILHISNDLPYGMTVSVKARELTRTGEVISEPYELEAKVKGYSVSRIELPFDVNGDRLIVCDVGKDRCFYRRGALELCDATDALCVVSRDADSITLRAEKYLHAVELEGEYLFEDNCFSMLEGETRTIGFERIGEEGFEVRAYSF